MKVRTSLRQALNDQRLLGKALAGDSLARLAHHLARHHGREADRQELATFRAVTGRHKAPTKRCEELIGIVGRRGGKSRAVAVLCHLSQHPDRLPRRAGHRRAWPAVVHRARL